MDDDHQDLMRQDGIVKGSLNYFFQALKILLYSVWRPPTAQARPCGMGGKGEEGGGRGRAMGAMASRP